MPTINPNAYHETYNQQLELCMRDMDDTYIQTNDCITDVSFGSFGGIDLFIGTNEPGTMSVFWYSVDCKNWKKIPCSFGICNIHKKVLMCYGFIFILQDSKLYYIDGSNHNFDNIIEVNSDLDTVVDIEIINGILHVVDKMCLFRVCIGEDLKTPIVNKIRNLPSDFNVNGIVKNFTGNEVILYENNETLPIFTMYNDDEWKIFASANKFKIHTAVIFKNLMILYTENNFIYTLNISDPNISVFDFQPFNSYFWIGDVTYNNGFIYAAYLDLSRKTPTTVICKSRDGVSFEDEVRLPFRDYSIGKSVFGNNERCCVADGTYKNCPKYNYTSYSPYMYNVNENINEFSIKETSISFVANLENFPKYGLQIDSVLANLTIVIDGLTTLKSHAIYSPLFVDDKLQHRFIVYDIPYNINNIDSTKNMVLSVFGNPVF